MIVRLYMAHSMSGSNQCLPSNLLIKIVFGVVSAVCLTIFVVFSMHWGKHHIGIALCEWTGVLCIQFFNLSVWTEYQGCVCCRPCHV